MQVDVRDGLAAVPSAIDHGTVPRLREPEVGGDSRGDELQAAHHPDVVPGEICERADVPTWDYQHVLRGLRVDVTEREELVVVKNLVAGNLTGDDLAEQAIRHIDTFRLGLFRIVSEPSYHMPFRRDKRPGI